MSMLAEKKQKTTWILDPRQNDWTRDSNKFGQRMLEKMGWTPGKGLGASEQGITNALRIKYKSDNRGLGCMDPKFECLAQQKKFEMLLSELNSERSSPEPEKKLSLEEKSKMTKKRVFYHKSIKGKDITKYSERDLQCIFGFDSKGETHKTNCDPVEDISEKHFHENTEINLIENGNNKKKKKHKETTEVMGIETGEQGMVEQQIENQEGPNRKLNLLKKKKKSKNLSDEQLSESIEKLEDNPNIKKKKRTKKHLNAQNGNCEGILDIMETDKNVTIDQIESQNLEGPDRKHQGFKKKKQKYALLEKEEAQENREIPVNCGNENSLDIDQKKKRKRLKVVTEELIEDTDDISKNKMLNDCEEVGNKESLFKKKRKKTKNKECL